MLNSTRDNCSVVAAAAEERSAAVASLNNEREGGAGWGVFSLSNGDESERKFDDLRRGSD